MLVLAEFHQRVGHIDTNVDFTMQKVSYVAINLIGLFMAAYKLSNLGLLPTTDSDWLEFMQQAPVSQAHLPDPHLLRMAMYQVVFKVALATTKKEKC